MSSLSLPATPWRRDATVIGLVGVMVAAPAYYAQQDMRTPMRVAIGARPAHGGAAAAATVAEASA